MRFGADRVVERDRLEDVEQLALVFVDALDVHVEHGRGIDAYAALLVDIFGERFLVRALYGGEPVLRGGILDIALEIADALDVVDDAGAHGLAQQVCQRRIGIDQPAPRRDAVRLVDDAAGQDLVEILKYGLLHQVRVQR